MNENQHRLIEGIYKLSFALAVKKQNMHPALSEAISAVEKPQKAMARVNSTRKRIQTV